MTSTPAGLDCGATCAPSLSPNAAALDDTGGAVLWVIHGATETGEAVAMHLEPLTGKLIAFHVGGDR